MFQVERGVLAAMAAYLAASRVPADIATTHAAVNGKTEGCETNQERSDCARVQRQTGILMGLSYIIGLAVASGYVAAWWAEREVDPLMFAIVTLIAFFGSAAAVRAASPQPRRQYPRSGAGLMHANHCADMHMFGNAAAVVLAILFFILVGMTERPV